MTKFKKSFAALMAVVSTASALCVPMGASAANITDNNTQTVSSSDAVYASLGGIYYNKDDIDSHLSFGFYTCTLKNVKADDGIVVSCTSVSYTLTNNGTILITLPAGGYTTRDDEAADITRFVTAALSGTTITTWGGETFER